MYGINHRCCLSVLSYIDPTKCFPQDLMQLLHEGILNLESRLLLTTLIDDGLIDLKTINYKMSRLKFHREFTKPPPILSHEIREKKTNCHFLHQKWPDLLLHFNWCYLNSFLKKKIPVMLTSSYSLRSMHLSNSYTEEDISELESDILFHN